MPNYISMLNSKVLMQPIEYLITQPFRTENMDYWRD